MTPSSSTSGAAAVVRGFAELGAGDVAWAGGKGANLGELTGFGMPVPGGFVVGAPAYAEFFGATGLRERVGALFDGVEAEDTDALTRAANAAHALLEETEIPDAIAGAILDAYRRLRGGDDELPVAVRSSATAEDTASASFAGMNASFLNVHGDRALLHAVRDCWASLFSARTVYYRARRGFGATEMDIAVVVQRQLAAKRSGVMFTIDPATGDAGRIVIEGSFGLGEAVVSGSVSPDRYVIDKDGPMIVEIDVRRKEMVIEPLADGGTRERRLGRLEGSRAALTDGEALEVARAGLRIEEHYGRPQDIEWAFDPAGAMWIVQARPVTTAAGGDGLGEAAAGAAATGDVGATAAAGAVAGPPIVQGLGTGTGRASGAARMITALRDAGKLQAGEVLVAHTTAPDWVPLMRKAAAIVTDTGGMTCHAAIVARELGIPCVVGTRHGTQKIHDGQLVTVDAAAGTVSAGTVSAGAAPAGAEAGTAAEHAAPAPAGPAPQTRTKILVNLSDPAQIERAAAMDVDGVGLLRAELLVVHALDGMHPKVLVESGRGDQFVTTMRDALRRFAAGFAPRPVTYRTIDFRSNEFAGLEGGERFEPEEANPMIGLRGVQRYVRDPEFFALELRAIRGVYEAGLANLHVMLPFLRTAHELAQCRELIAGAGMFELDGFELWVMAEVPSVLFNLEAIAAAGCAGISIGSNDLTQLLLGIDRDSETLADAFDERDPAVLAYLRELIPRARALGLKTSICGQAPSIHPEYAAILVELGIDAISVSADAVDRTRRLVAAAEAGGGS